MKAIIIHARTGDTVALVARTEELDKMNLEYTEIKLDDKQIKKNPDLSKDLEHLVQRLSYYKEYT